VTIAIEFNDKLHAAQLSAVGKIQDLTIFTLRRMASIRDKAPKAPQRVGRLTEPLSNQLATHRRDWQDLGDSFRERLKNTVEGSPAVTRPVSVTTGSKSTPTEKTTRKA
jgi:hypothetical protein